jgi:hypothetical protein
MEDMHDGRQTRQTERCELCGASEFEEPVAAGAQTNRIVRCCTGALAAALQAAGAEALRHSGISSPWRAGPSLKQLAIVRCAIPILPMSNPASPIV